MILNLKPVCCSKLLADIPDLILAARRFFLILSDPERKQPNLKRLLSILSEGINMHLYWPFIQGHG